MGCSADEHGCRSQHVSNSNSASVKTSFTLPSPTASTQPSLPRSIHHPSSMATSDIELTQVPTSRFSRYSVDFPPPFAHLLIQSSDPVLNTTHAIGDKVEFETYPSPCIFLGTKRTAAPIDNEARREYEAEFGVPGISSSSAHPPMIFRLQLQDQIQRDRIRLPPSMLSWEWFQDKLRTYCCL
jgi:hypothetical protein